MNRRRYIMVFFVVLMLVVSVAPSFAQSTIEFDTTALISESNNWITTFLPILAIPFGISIAMALIFTVGNLIVTAIRSLSKSR